MILRWWYTAKHQYKYTLKMQINNIFNFTHKFKMKTKIRAQHFKMYQWSINNIKIQFSTIMNQILRTNELLSGINNFLYTTVV